MPKLLPCALSLFLIAFPAAAEIRHELEVSLSAELGLKVRDRIELPDGERRSFRLAPQLTVTRLEADGRALPLAGASGSWQVPPHTRLLTVEYGGTLPPREVERRQDAADHPFVSGDGAFLPSWSGWVPDFGDGPVGYRLVVTTADPMVAVATGGLVDEHRGHGRYRATFASPFPGEGPSLFAGPYKILERKAGDLALRAYLHPELPDGLGAEYLQLSEQLIGGFAATIGPYPFDAFRIVSAPLPVGLGFPGMTYIDRRILPLPFIRGQSLGHEILHNWWGNGVVPDYAHGNWGEGLTTYLADYGLAASEQQRQMRLNWLRDYAALPGGRDTSVVEFRTKQHDAAQVVGYNKVAFVFHMLRNEIGAAAFETGLRRLWTKHRHSAAGWPDLQSAFEEASGRKLDGFFAQWLRRRGAPSIGLVEAKAIPDAGRWRVHVRIAQDTPAYALDIPIAIETAAGRQTFRLALGGAEASGSFLTMERPTAVAVDPDFDLFRRLAPGEAPPTLRDVTLSDATGVVILGKDALAETAQALATRLLDAGGKPIPAEAAADHAGPLLVIGLEAQVAPLMHSLGLAGPPARSGSARAWVARRDRGAVLAVEVIDVAALKAVLRPLPHYGRESWLIFDGAKVIDKGLWPAGDNPLRRRL